jgi:hypothetical protein
MSGQYFRLVLYQSNGCTQAKVDINSTVVQCRLHHWLGEDLGLVTRVSVAAVVGASAPSSLSTSTMAHNEHAPLLPHTNGHSEPRRPFVHRVLDTLKGSENEPSWATSYRYYLFGSWLNALLIFVPLSFLSDRLEWDAGLRFGFSFMAIVPLAKLLGEATDQLSVKLGQTLGGLLNASFGNAVEIIVGVAALMQGKSRSCHVGRSLIFVTTSRPDPHCPNLRTTVILANVTCDERF